MDPNTQPPLPPMPMKPVGPKDERLWGMGCHLAALSGYLIPFGSIIGPLIIWLVKREEYGLVNDQGRESLNFQLTMLVGFLLCIPLMFACGVGAILAIILAVLDLVFVIIAAIKANEGVPYRYPLCIRFIH
jgi:hypothetical protein